MIVYKIKNKQTGLFLNGYGCNSRSWRENGRIFLSKRAASGSLFYARNIKKEDIEIVKFKIIES